MDVYTAGLKALEDVDKDLVLYRVMVRVNDAPVENLYDVLVRALDPGGAKRMAVDAVLFTYRNEAPGWAVDPRATVLSCKPEPDGLGVMLVGAHSWADV